MQKPPHRSAISKMTEARTTDLLDEIELIVSELKKRNVDVNNNGKL